MSDLMEKTIDQAALDRAQELLRKLEEGCPQGITRVDYFHLMERLSSHDEMMVLLGLGLYDRLFETVTEDPDPTPIEASASDQFLEAVQAVTAQMQAVDNEIIDEIRRLVGSRRLLVQSLLPEKSRKGLHFFLANPKNPGEMPVAHLEKLRCDLKAVIEEIEKIDAMEEAAQAANLEKDLVIDEIEAKLRPGNDRDYQAYFEERVGKSLKRSALRQRDLSGIQRILAQVLHLDARREQEAEERRVAKAADMAARPPKTSAKQAPPSGPTWMVKHAKLPVGRPNPQGVPGVASKRGGVVPGAGKGTKEKSRKKA